MKSVSGFLFRKFVDVVWAVPFSRWFGYFATLIGWLIAIPLAVVIRLVDAANNKKRKAG